MPFDLHIMLKSYHVISYHHLTTTTQSLALYPLSCLCFLSYLILFYPSSLSSLKEVPTSFLPLSLSLLRTHIPQNTKYTPTSIHTRRDSVDASDPTSLLLDFLFAHHIQRRMEEVGRRQFR